MPEGSTLHPIDPALLDRYLAALAGELPAAELVPADPAWAERVMAKARAGHERAREGSEQGANAVSFGFGQLLATAQPSFFLPGASLTFWEARVDRGAGMLMRPPSRLFGDAGLDAPSARAMPIRLDSTMTMMGGAWIPARLMPQLVQMLEEREARLIRRLVDAEMDAVPLYALMHEAAAHAASRGLGLYEALDVIVPDAPQADPPGARVLAPDRKRIPKDVRARLEAAAKPPKEPGLLARVFGRRAH